VRAILTKREYEKMKLAEDRLEALRADIRNCFREVNDNDDGPTKIHILQMELRELLFEHALCGDWQNIDETEFIIVEG